MRLDDTGQEAGEAKEELGNSHDASKIGHEVKLRGTEALGNERAKRLGPNNDRKREQQKST